jgi:hypothetical protein
MLCWVTPCIVSPRSLLGDTVNTWMTQEWGGVTWPPHVPQWHNNRKAMFFRVSDQGFIGGIEARLWVVLGQFLVGGSCARFVVEEDFMWTVFSWVKENNRGSENSAVQVSSRRELWRMLLWRQEDLCVIFGVWDCGSLCVEIRCCEATSGVSES